MKTLFDHEIRERLTADILCGTKPKWSITCKGETYYVSCSYDLPEEGQQDDCCVSLWLPSKPQFAWSPHLTPEEGYIAAQHVFRTPALIFGYEDQTWILIPDHEVLENQVVPGYLDMDAVNGKMMVGLSKSQVTGHVLYKKKEGALWPKGKAEIAFYLMFFEQKLENPFREVLSFYWNNYGRKTGELSTEVRQAPYMSYAAHTYQWAFEHWRDVVWQEFQLGEKTVGAPVFIVTTTQSPNYKGVKKERELRSVWNQAWFCSLRSASGLYRYARRIQSEKLKEYAEKTKELALAFPQKDGFFDAVIATEMENFEKDGSIYMRSLGWETKYFGNSDRNPFGLDVKDAPKHVLDMSFTAEYMLQWYEELEQDERLLVYAGNYAERLLELQFDNGYFPGWISEDGRALGVLDDSPESAMTAVFLLHYGRLVKDERFIASAQKAVDVIRKEIIPTGRWEDFETYWSCSHFWNDHVGEKVQRNNMYKQCNFSMFFTAWALLDLYEATGEEVYLKTGQRVLDEMLMTQSSYQPKSMPIPTVGGFGVLNADAELNDARQSLFAELIIRYGKHLNMNEYLERGMIALKRAFTMMYCPENPEVKVQWEKAWPFLNEQDYGFNMENYGHNGEIDENGLGIGEFTIYDWGNGAAAEAYMRILDHYEKDEILS